MRKIVLMSLCLAVAITLASCEKMETENPVTINLDGTTKLRLSMQVSPDLGIHSGEVTISKGDMVQSKPLEFDGGYSSVLFSDLQPGTWLIEVVLRDADGSVLYAGSGEAGVIAGQTTTATIVVGELLGDLEVIIELDLDEEDGLIAYYPFNSDANDESGNNHDGTVHGAALTSDRFDNPESAYDFDGDDDYIDLNDALIPQNGDFSISMWINANAELIANKPFLTQYHYPSVNRCMWYIADSGNLSFKMRIGDSTGEDFDTDIAVTQNQWHHVVFIRNGSTIEYFLDRDEMESGSYSGAILDYNTIIGARVVSGAGNHFKGSIDDVRIFNYAISAGEVDELFTVNGLTPKRR